jgi:lysophospholipase L1-like esterase
MCFRPILEVSKLRYKLLLILFSFLLFLIINCDRKKSSEDFLIDVINCQIVNACSPFSHYGMVGDSWTDFAFGYDLAEDLYDQLTKKYGYKITASNLAGLTLRTELEERMGYINVIKKAGPEIQYILLSLGGNDLIFPTSNYYTDGFEITISSRLNAYAYRLKTLILYGDQLKRNLYGGESLKWVIHGYDYPNPEFDSSCILSALNAGMNREDANRLPQQVLDRFNETLKQLSREIRNLYYIDLRKTLGGPPYSNPDWMTDCLHPNTLGFSLIAEVYVQNLKIIENL